jgi:hypothetical protein
VFTRPRIERQRGGSFRVRLPRGERTLLRGLAVELEQLLDGGRGNPDLRRLFPPAYADSEPEAEADYREMMERELEHGRRAALRTLVATVDRDELTEPEAEAWLGVLNDGRLVLGTRLGVTDETLFAGVSPLDPRAREIAVYLYLSWLQEQLVEALAGGLAP